MKKYIFKSIIYTVLYSLFLVFYGFIAGIIFDGISQFFLYGNIKLQRLEKAIFISSHPTFIVFYTSLVVFGVIPAILLFIKDIKSYISLIKLNRKSNKNYKL